MHRRLMSCMIIISLIMGTVSPVYAVEPTPAAGEESMTAEGDDENREVVATPSPSVMPEEESSTEDDGIEVSPSPSAEAEPSPMVSPVPSESGDDEAAPAVTPTAGVEDGDTTGQIFDLDTDMSPSAAVSPFVSPSPEVPADFYTEYPLGYIDVPEDESPESVSVYAKGQAPLLRSSYTDPSYINTNLPMLRNQNPYPSCWAFSSVALAELSLMQRGISGSPDLSELHLAYFTYHSVTDPLGGTAGDDNAIASGNYLSIGGNLVFSQNILAGWAGAADESVAPYTEADRELTLDPSLAYSDAYHLTDYYEVNISDDRNEVKKLILQNGAVGASFYAYSGVSAATGENTYNTETNSYYNPEARTVSPKQNHAITIVGWDDDYPKENFASTPEGDGAWLVRNSWLDGMSYDDPASHKYAGYFWMSYYEATLNDKVHSFVFDEGDNYENNHQYDGGMYTTALTIGDNRIKAADIFEADEGSSGEDLKAVSFYTSTTNAAYTIDVYTSLEDETNPESGDKIASASGMTRYAGYYTIELDETAYIPKGEKFSVVVTLEKDGFKPTIGAEKEYTTSVLDLDVSIAEGQSFLYMNSNWKDMAEDASSGRGNLRIKAFTDNSEKYRLIFKLDGGRFEGLEDTCMYLDPHQSPTQFLNDKGFDISNEKNYPVKAGFDFIAFYNTGIPEEQTEANKFDFDRSLTEDTYVYAKWEAKEEDESLLETTTKAEDGQMHRVVAAAADKIFSNKDGNYQTTVTVTDQETGRKLKAGRDYDNDVIYTYVRDTELYDGTIRKAGDGAVYSGKRDRVPAGTTMRVTVQGKGSYAGLTMYTAFRVVTADIAKASVRINPQYCTGERIVPGYDQILVKLGGNILTDQDYEITGPSIGNVSPTTGAFVTIYGRGDYGGSKVVKFSILEVPEQSIISFNPNGATSGKMKDIKLVPGKDYSLTSNSFKRLYYEFTGWNTEPDGDLTETGTHYDDKQFDPIMTDEGDTPEVHILYAQWKPIDYTITYHCNGGPNHEDNVRTGYNAADEDIRIYSPEREDWPVGYQFGGWYTDSSYRNKTNVIKAGSHGNIDLYAKWIPYTYTVHFNPNGGQGSMGDETFSYGVPKAISANKYKREGYVFCGWTADKAFSDSDVAAVLNDTDATDEDFAALADYADRQTVTNILDNADGFKGEVTLYALWRSEYRVSFDIGDNTDDKARWGNTAEETLPEGMICVGPAGARKYYMSYSYGTGLTLPASGEIYRPGYSFAGWYRDPMYKSKVKSISKKQTGELTLYAKWTPLKYKLVFKPAFKENGKGKNSGRMSTLTCTYGKNVTLPANAYISMGYRFAGWSTAEDDTAEFDDKAYTQSIESYPGAEDKILPTRNNQVFNLYAVWEGVSGGRYDIQYDMNGGSFLDVLYIDSYDADLKLVYGDLPTADHVEKEGYKFAGWYTDPTCKKKFTSVKGRDITLYAKWVGTARYSVDYLPNLPEGITRYTGRMARTTGFVVGTSKALRKNSYKIPGYTFLGWKIAGKVFDEEDERQYDYENAEKLLLDNTYIGYPIIDGVLTLEAVWHKDTYGIVYNNTVGAVNDDNPVTYEVDTDDIILREPSMTGNTFLGWYTDKKFKKKITKIPKGSTGTKTIYAKWKAMYYTIQYDLNSPDPDADPVLDMTHVGYIVSYDKRYDGGYLLPTASLEGYTFDGWYKDKKGKKKVGQVIASPYVDLILFAKWIPDINVSNPRITGKIEEPATCFNVVDFGAVAGDGLDDLAAFRAAMDKAAKSSSIKTVYVPAGVYDIKPENPHNDGQPAIHLKNNVNIVMDRYAILKATPVSMSGDFCIICGEENSNVTITGGQIWGERAGHMGSSGESGHGIYLAGCSDITIEKMVIKSNWGDGIYVADRKVYSDYRESENITVRTCELVDNRRNNISLISGKTVTIEDCEIEAIRGGTSPDCGICIEPNWRDSKKVIYPEQYIEDLLVKDTNITTYKQNDSDYRCFMTLYNPPVSGFTTADGIRFEKCTFNGFVGNYSGYHLTYDSATRFKGEFVDLCGARLVD